MRHYQIRDCDKNGNGSFYSFDVEDDACDGLIRAKAANLINNAKRQAESHARFAVFPTEIKYRFKVKVVEMVKNKNGFWVTKRKGHKFKLVNSWVEVTSKNGKRVKVNEYH